MLRIVEIDQIDDARRYAGDWSRLLRQTPHASFFQTLDWLDIYWRHFGSRNMWWTDGRPSPRLPALKNAYQ